MLSTEDTQFDKWLVLQCLSSILVGKIIKYEDIAYRRMWPSAEGIQHIQNPFLEFQEWFPRDGETELLFEGRVRAGVWMTKPAKCYRWRHSREKVSGPSHFQQFCTIRRKWGEWLKKEVSAAWRAEMATLLKTRVRSEGVLSQDVTHYFVFLERSPQPLCGGQIRSGTDSGQRVELESCWEISYKE